MMYCRNFFSLLLVVFLGISLIGCGADEEAAFEVSDKAPTVRIEKVGHEIIDRRDPVVATYKVVADTEPKTDMLVKVAISGKRWQFNNSHRPCKSYYWDDYWVTIPKGKKESQGIQAPNFLFSGNSYMAAEVVPLPIVSIVGEGEVIDQQSLQNEYGGSETEDGQKIPENFVFPYYEADTKKVTLYRPKKAKIVNTDPPPGDFVHQWGEIIITFDTFPECPRSTSLDAGLAGGGSEFDIGLSPFNFGLARGEFKLISLTFSWGSEEAGTAASQSFEYKVFRRN